MSQPIYFDYCATTPIDPRVLQTLEQASQPFLGNASSHTHLFGWKAQFFVREARQALALLLNCSEEQLFFTSGATEANNMTLYAIAQAFRGKAHVITSSIEHSCILNTCEYWKKQGAIEHTKIGVNSQGKICLEELKEAIRPHTRLISVMAVNNETGVIQNLHEVSAIAQQHQILFHSDAAQGVGKISLDLSALPLDFMSLSGHKFYGPTGVGALYAKDPSLLQAHPLLHGGGQELGVRAGTLHTLGCIGIGAAASIAQEELQDENERLLRFKKYLIHLFSERLPDFTLNGCEHASLPGVMNFQIPHISAKQMLSSLRKKVALSTGSACTSTSRKPSHVLTAMGRDAEQCQSSFRLSMGRFTTREEVETGGNAIVEAVHSLTSPQVREGELLSV